jgi:hypothetical protein
MKTNFDFDIEPNLQQSGRLGTNYPSGGKRMLCDLHQVCGRGRMTWFEAHRRSSD